MFIKGGIVVKTLTVGLEDRTYRILIGGGLLDRVGALIAEAATPSVAVVLTDDNVWSLYGERLEAALGDLPHRVLVLPHGEQTKCVEQYARCLSFCAESGLTRGDLVLAFGGGVIGDLAGFVAATYMRGVRFVQIPTTLLAQVDSAVGGKTAIDLPEGKNLVGAFHQPSLVIADTALLQTLSPREQAGGMAEVIKYGALFDAAFFELLEAHPTWEAITPLLDEVVLRCCDLKRQVVEQDERDNGARQLLNFGHTYGHAIEAIGEYTDYIHGEGVALGMVLAAKVGIFQDLTPVGTDDRLESLCDSFGLPMTDRFAAAALNAHLALDKKRDKQILRLVLLRQIGNGFLHTVSMDEAYALTEGIVNGD